jgi:hypothetical protein
VGRPAKLLVFHRTRAYTRLGSPRRCGAACPSPAPASVSGAVVSRRCARTRRLVGGSSLRGVRPRRHARTILCDIGVTLSGCGRRRRQDQQGAWRSAPGIRDR